MKVFSMRILSALSISALLVLTGCAITPPTTATKNDAARLSTTVSTPVVDGVTVTAAVLDIQEIDPVTGKNAGAWKRTVHLFNSLPTLGEMAKGIVGGTGAALIQKSAAEKVAKIGKCADGANCGTVIVNEGGQAVSGSSANSSSATAVGVDVKTGTTGTAGCSTCADWGKYAKP